MTDHTPHPDVAQSELARQLLDAEEDDELDWVQPVPKSEHHSENVS